MLQKHAHNEVGQNVLHAERRRHPKKIANQVLECTLMVEKIPKDPRVLRTENESGHTVLAACRCRSMIPSVLLDGHRSRCMQSSSIKVSRKAISVFQYIR